MTICNKCSKHANYGPIGTTIRLSCRTHALPDYDYKPGKRVHRTSTLKKNIFCFCGKDLANDECTLCTPINIKYRICKCGKNASYGLLSDGIRRSCSKHKKDGYLRLNVVPNTGKKDLIAASILMSLVYDKL